MNLGILIIVVLFLGIFSFDRFTKKDNIKTDLELEKKVSIIIPAYNEEETVANTVRIAKSRSYVDEVIVINDGSNDNTLNEAKSAGATVISHTKNRGKGAALNTGLENSKNDIIAFIDADIFNLDGDKIDQILEPILSKEADIVKTKFKREGGRVTELTAKPLLKFFFPELKYDQPLSGQFAGKRSALEKIKFETDYGVDVGIVLDADLKGIKIKEVDIGSIKHDMSSLDDLNKMASEVVRTIIERAVIYGRVTMLDSLGESIRLAILGLSLATLGFFSLFFVKFIPVYIGVFIVVVGFLIAIFHLFRVIRQSVFVIRKQDMGSGFKSILYMHFPVIVSGIILFLMITTMVGALNVSDGQVSVELTSRNLILWQNDSNQTIAVRGPYTVDSALENENTIIRMPQDAMDTLGLHYGDVIYIGNYPYTFNMSRPGEDDLMRIPLEARNELKLNLNSTITDNNLKTVFYDLYVNTKQNMTDYTISQGIYIKNKNYPSKTVNITVDGSSYVSVGHFKGENYDIFIDDSLFRTIYINNSTNNATYYFDYGNHSIFINITEAKESKKEFANANDGIFLNLRFINSD